MAMWVDETEPEVSALVCKFDKGGPHSPGCRLAAIDEGLTKLGFGTNPVWKAVGDNVEKGHKSTQKLNELIRLN